MVKSENEPGDAGGLFRELRAQARVMECDLRMRLHARTPTDLFPLRAQARASWTTRKNEWQDGKRARGPAALAPGRGILVREKGLRTAGAQIMAARALALGPRKVVGAVVKRSEDGGITGGNSDPPILSRQSGKSAGMNTPRLLNRNADAVVAMAASST